MEGKRSAVIVRLTAGLVLGIAALAVALRDVQMAELGSRLRAIDGLWLSLSLVGVLGVALAKAARWRAMFAIPRPAFSAIFSAMVIGQTTNVLLPFRLGEVARALALKRGTGVPAALGLGTLAAEKLADLALFGLGVLILALVVDLPGWLRSAAVTIVAIGTAVVIAGGIVALRPAWRTAIVNRMPDRTRAFLTNLIAGGSVLWSSGVRRAVWLWTIGIWLLSLVTPAALAAATDHPLALPGLITLLLALQVTFIVPTPPGLLGVVQAVCVLILPQYGFDATAAFAYGLALNAVMVIPLVVCGALAWVHTVAHAPAREPLSSP